MTTFRTTGHWQQTDRESGKVVSGETFTCAHCGHLFDIVFGEAPAMCHHEWLPVCQPCHGIGTCPAKQEEISFLERRLKALEGRDRLMRSIGI